MKRIVCGKLYDTEKATRLVEWDNGKQPSDFYYDYSNLYVTNSGIFFITNNIQIDPDEISEEIQDQKIRILSKSEVLEWMEFRQLTPEDFTEENFYDHFEIEEA